MSRLTPLVLLAALAGLTAAGDPPAAPPTKLPSFKGYTTVATTVTARVKAASEDSVTVVVPEFSLSRTQSYGRSRRPPTVHEKDVEHTLTLHPDALVRWSKKPDRKDDKGRPKPYTPAEMRTLQSPAGAPGYLGDKQELAAGQTVELTLLVPAKKLPEDLKESDYLIKYAVILGSPSDAKPKEAKKADLKDKK